MATHISSETLPQNRIATETNTPPTLIVTINNVNYKIEIVLHKKGQSKEDGYLINPAYLNIVIMRDSLFDTFPMLIINYEDKESNKLPYAFSYDSDDRAFVYLSKIQKEGEIPPYPLVDDDFVIIRNLHEQSGGSNDNSKFFGIQLYMLPTIWLDLTNTFPQWTTGFDTDYQKKSGKEVGTCIKEILKIVGGVTDDPIFDAGKSIINYTSQCGQSALDTIGAILPYFLPSEGKITPGVFKYNPVTHKFTLQSIQSFFEHKDLDDDIKTHPVIPLRQLNDDKAGEFASTLTAGQVPIDWSHNIQHSIVTLDQMQDKILRISRQKGTFVIDPQEFDLDKIAKQALNNFRDKDEDFGQSENDLVKRDEVITRKVEFTPHYRKAERDGLNKQTTQYLLTSSKFGASLPLFGGEIQTGRKFTVRVVFGAQTEELMKKTGTYLIINTVHKLSIREDYAETDILGANVIKTEPGKYNLFNSTVAKST